MQGNLGLIEKREEPAESLRRHLDLTSDLKQKGVEFVVWSESSVAVIFPERDYRAMMREQFTHSIGMPAIFGSVLFSEGALQQQLYNTALSVDARGEVTGRYDKEFLLAFGEYLPLGDVFPKLYEWSPNSGHFTPGTTVDPLLITLGGMTHPVSALVCYEDILPSFTNHVVAVAKPDLLVNMSNDAWFGDSSEPWEHLALAQLRAVEHRRYMVRSTNSGVSAIIDPVGRVMVHGKTFDAEALDAVVHWLHDGTVYEAIGDAPWYLLTMLLFAAAFVRRKGLPVATALLTVACSSGGSPSRSADAGSHDASLQDGTTQSDAQDAAPPVDAGLCPAIAAVDFGGPTCDLCTATHCCPPATRCYALSDSGGAMYCAVLADCLAQCAAYGAYDGGTDAEVSCNADCQSEYGKGNAPFQAMQTCIYGACTNEGGTGPCNN